MPSNAAELSEIRGLLGRGAFEAAERAARSMLDGGGPNPSVLMLLGAALTKQERLEEATVCLHRALDADKSLIEGWNWLSICLRQLGRLQESEDACLTALRYKPDDPGANFNLGLTYLAAEKFDRAVACLEEALLQHPTNPHLLQNLGLAYQEAGESEKARACFVRSAKLAPTADQPLVSLGSLQLELGDAPGALETAHKALTLSPNSVAALTLAARISVVLDRADLARVYLERILQMDPRNGLAYALLGAQQQVEGKFVEAERSFESSIQVDPFQGLAYWGIVQSKKEVHALRVPHLLDLANDTRVSGSERPYLFYTVGKIYDDTGEYARALEAYDKANELAAKAAFRGKRMDVAAFRSGFARLMSVFSRAFIDEHPPIGSDSNRPIFIVGMIRSGTTLMEQLLSNHPEVFGKGEIRFWNQEGRECVDLATARIDGLKARHLVKKYLSVLDFESGGAAYVTDKTPEDLQMVGLINILFPNAKIVNMTRNPVDNCLSIYTTPYAFPPEFAYVRENIAIAYEEHFRLADHWRRTLPNGVMIDVSYEGLTADPESALRSVLDHCGLPWSDLCLKPQENKRRVRTPSLWQARQPIYRSSSARWKNYQGLLPEFEGLLATKPG